MELNSFKRELLAKEFLFLQGNEEEWECAVCEEKSGSLSGFSGSYFIGESLCTHKKVKVSCNWPNFLRDADSLKIKKADGKLLEKVGELDTSSERTTYNSFWLVFNNLVLPVPETCWRNGQKQDDGLSIAEFLLQGYKPRYILEEEYDSVDEFYAITLYKVKDDCCTQSLIKGFRQALKEIERELIKE